MGRERADQAFLISQIGKTDTDVRKRADEVLKYIVAPVVEDFKLKLLRSDLDLTPGQVTAQILGSILNSKVVVADLTGRNPNVYYELGVVHSFGVPIVILGDNANSLSFDAQNERVIEIGDDGIISASQADSAKKRLQETLSVILEEGYKPSSLVTEVARARNLEELAPENAVASEVANIKQRLDEVYLVVRHSPRERSRSIDMRVLTRFIKALSEDGRLKSEELLDLIDDETSPSFDRWIEEVVAAIPSHTSQDIDLNEEDFDDIPF